MGGTSTRGARPRRRAPLTPRRRRAAALVVVVLLLAACTVDEATTAPMPAPAPESAPEPAPPTGPAPAPATDRAPEPAPAPVPLPDLAPKVPEEVAGATLTDGYTPHPHLRGEDGRVVWPAEAAMPQAVGDPPVPDGLGPLAITAAVDRWRLTCTEWERRVVGVDVGADAVAASIADGIVAAAADLHDGGWTGWFTSEADCEGTHPSSAVGRGSTYQELSEEPCALPDGPPLRCFLLAEFGYPAGAAHTYLRMDQLVFDATTGERLDVDDLLRAAGLDPAEVEAVVNDLVCRLDACWGVEVERTRPTIDALVIPFAPYEAGPFSEYTRKLTVAWELLVTPDA